jgi:hypothetical protein
MQVMQLTDQCFHPENRELKLLGKSIALSGVETDCPKMNKPTRALKTSGRIARQASDGEQFDSRLGGDYALIEN